MINLLAGLQSPPIKSVVPGMTPYNGQTPVQVGAMSKVPASMGQRAISPSANISTPPTTLPAAQKAPLASATTSTPGMYKGTAITPGSDADIQAQIAKIDGTPAVQTPTQTPSYPGLMGANIKAQQTQAPVTPPASPTYQGLIGSAAGQAGALNTTAGNINTTAGQIGTQGQMTPEEVQARQELANLDAAQASNSQNIETHPGVGGFAMGRDAINLQNIEAARSSLSQRIAAYAAERTASQGAYTAEANAQNQAGGLQNQAGGLYQGAATSVAPQLGAIGQVPFSPLDQNQGSVLGSTQPGGVAAAGNLLGQLQGAQAAGAAPGQAQAANTQTTGTAQTGAYNKVYSDATQAAATYSQQQSAINAIGSQALGLMASDPNINQFVTQFGNKTLNSLNTQLSDPKYAAFNTAIQSLQARIGAALQAGEIPTAATSNASSIANGNITLDALASTLKQVDSEMSAFVGTQQALAQYAQQKMQSGAGASSNSSGGGSYTSSSGATYNLPY